MSLKAYSEEDQGRGCDKASHCEMNNARGLKIGAFCIACDKSVYIRSYWARPCGVNALSVMSNSQLFFNVSKVGKRVEFDISYKFNQPMFFQSYAPGDHNNCPELDKNLLTGPICKISYPKLTLWDWRAGRLPSHSISLGWD